LLQSKPASVCAVERKPSRFA